MLKIAHSLDFWQCTCRPSLFVNLMTLCIQVIASKTSTANFLFLFLFISFLLYPILNPDITNSSCTFSHSITLGASPSSRRSTLISHPIALVVVVQWSHFCQVGYKNTPALYSLCVWILLTSCKTTGSLRVLTHFQKLHN